MAGVLTDLGCKEILTNNKTTWNTTALKLALFKTNVTPTTSSVLADFVEADFAGYARQNIVTWPTPSVAGHVASMAAAPNTFTRSTSGTVQTVWGYLVLDNAGTTLLWAEKDANAPINLTNAGDAYTVTATLAEKDTST